MLSSMPVAFFFCCLLLLFFTSRAWAFRYDAWGIPAMAVYGTAIAWYLGDALYNDYSDYESRFGLALVENAWWQVCLFVAAFGWAVERVHRFVNKDQVVQSSRVLYMVETGALSGSSYQFQLDLLSRAMFVVWCGLMIAAVLRLDFDFVGIFMPYLGERANPWGRGRYGGSIDALLSFAGYLQVFLVAAFGVIFSVSRGLLTRALAACVCFLGLPYFVFGRSRNAILATVMPGLLCWVFIRLRGGFIKKAIVLGGAGVLANFWFAFVLSNRNDNAVAAAFSNGVDFSQYDEVRHLGLNMFEELCFINSFLAAGTYEVNWGARYFAEVVNPIPRGLWSGKPLIGIDYAYARGKGGGADSAGGVTATISTGMIGQGVVNFGIIGGPIAAALLMSLWVAVLARQDLKCVNPGRLFVYACGLILTFNMGRDITLLVLYPFVFGWVLVAIWERRWVGATIASG